MIIVLSGKINSGNNFVAGLLNEKLKNSTVIDENLIDKEKYNNRNKIEKELFELAKKTSKVGIISIITANICNEKIINNYINNKYDVILHIKNKEIEDYCNTIKNIEYIDEIDINNLYDKYLKTKLETNLFN